VGNVVQVENWKSAQTELTRANKYKRLPDYTALDPRTWHFCQFAFVCSLLNDTAIKSHYTASRLMNCKGCGRKRSLPDLRCRASTCLGETRTARVADILTRIRGGYIASTSHKM
jgi:hypothetical protein